MAEKQEQVIRLSKKDRDLFKQGIKWMRFFSLMYLGLWIVMCTILFAIIYK